MLIAVHMNHNGQYQNFKNMKTWIKFVWKSIFYQKKLIDSVKEVECQKRIKEAENNLKKEFEEKLQFLQKTRVKFISKDKYPHIELLEMLPYSYETVANNEIIHDKTIHETILNQEQLYCSSYFVDTPMKYIEKEIALKLSEALLQNGFINMTIENNKIYVFINTYK